MQIAPTTKIRKGRRISRWLKRQQRRSRDWVVVLAPPIISSLLWLFSRTWRVCFVDAQDFFERWEHERILFTFWHNRVIAMPPAAHGRRVCIMISQSRDGEIASRVLQRWNIRAVRGSASRGGTSGSLQLLRAFRNGDSIAVVPDGPRGPRYEVKPGVVHLARATGAPLYPVSCGVTRFLQIRSWDRLIIPLPFATLIYVVGEPISVARDVDDADLDAIRQRLESSLRELTVRADGLARTEPQ